MTLFKCAGCKTALYCVSYQFFIKFAKVTPNPVICSQSKECQKANWPHHKGSCRNLQSLGAESAPEGDKLLWALDLYWRKNRSLLAQYGMDLPLDISCGLRDAVVVCLTLIPSLATKPEKAFVAVEVRVTLFESFGPQREGCAGT